MDQKRVEAFIGLIAAKAAYCRLPTTTSETRNTVLEAEVAFEAERILEEMKKDNVNGNEKNSERHREFRRICRDTGRGFCEYTGFEYESCYYRTCDRNTEAAHAGTDGEI